MKLTISGGRKAPTVESAIELHRKLVYYLLNYIYTIILECLNEYKLFSRNIKELLIFIFEEQISVIR